VLSDYTNVYEADVPAGSFDEVWKAKFRVSPLQPGRQWEAITYTADGAGLLLTAEGRPCPVFMMEPSRGRR
jgi:hypothetical protein